MSSQRVIIIGGGAAGFFAAIACARAAPDAEVTLLEKGSHLLSKVRISGGGRCNVTHACFDARKLTEYYPRGGRALIGAFQRFQPRDTIEWFESHGVKLKTEDDGRMFPVTDDSQTIIDCLMKEARNLNVTIKTNCSVKQIEKKESFQLVLSDDEILECDRVLIATGGCRDDIKNIVESLGHSVQQPIPSLFTFHIESSWLRELAGVSVDPVEVEVPVFKLRQKGALLITHLGVSGPAVLKLSAWGARELHQAHYEFTLRVNWLPRFHRDHLAQEFLAMREKQPGALVVNTPIQPFPQRLWEKIAIFSGVTKETKWTTLPKAPREQFIQNLLRMELAVKGKSPNKSEFVTCGGVSLKEVDFKTMESRICSGLYFAGEVLDIDGVTGGFNFQAAWTTGWIAGHAMAGNR